MPEPAAHDPIPMTSPTTLLALLADAVLARLAIAQHRPKPLLHMDAVEALARYNFPGNVRELENILERALALADGDVILAEDLHLPAADPMPHAAPAGQASAAPLPPSAQANAPAQADPRAMNPFDTASSALPSYIEEIERKAIEQALQENRYNKTKTAAQLGITFRALRYKLKKLGID